MSKKKNHYIDNKRFEELIQVYLVCPSSIDTELMVMFDQLISNIIDAFRFNVEKDDAKQDCFVLILKTLKNFTTDKGSAFNYFTTVILNNLKLVYSKGKRYDEKIANYRQHIFEKEGFIPNQSENRS